MTVLPTIARCSAPDELRSEGPDAHLVAMDEERMAIGRCSVWWSGTPTYRGQRIGYIGHFTARDSASATALLEKACAELARVNCKLAVGPVNGSTWRDYRFVTGSTGEPAFFLEPRNPPEWPRFFADAGFRPFAHYSSAIEVDLWRPYPGEQAAAARLKPLGLRIRPLDLSQARTELGRIFALSLAGFRSNLLFHTIPEGQFISRYEALLPFLCPELILLVERGSELVGFLFAIPDHSQSQRGESVDTVIIKTLTIAPGRAFGGLGRLLLSQARKVARTLGYRRMIHALMHDDNPSHALSKRCAQTIRRYAIFSKLLPS